MTDEHIIGEWKSRFFLVSFGCHLTMNHYEECLELFMKKQPGNLKAIISNLLRGPPDL